MIYIIVFSILGGLLVLFFLLTFIPYYLAFYNNRKNKPRSMEPMKGAQFTEFYDYMVDLINVANSIEVTEKVFIKSFDNIKLGARLYIHDNNRPWIIEVHGYKGCGVRDFAGGLPEFYNRGFNVLLLDHRGHGISQGRTITFGIKEHKDVISWINYLNQRFNTPKVFIYGISMGGNTVLLLNKDNLPVNVLGIMSDCPYTSAKEIVIKTVKEMKLSPKLFYPLLYLGALLYGHFKLDEVNAIDSVKKSGLPILLIHGTADQMVPFTMAKRIEVANPEKITLVAVENAPHGLSYIVNHLQVDKAICEYLSKQDPTLKDIVNLDYGAEVINPKTFKAKL